MQSFAAAPRSQRAFSHEFRAIPQNFVSFGWDALPQPLLSASPFQSSCRLDASLLGILPWGGPPLEGVATWHGLRIMRARRSRQIGQMRLGKLNGTMRLGIRRILGIRRSGKIPIGSEPRCAILIVELVTKVSSRKRGTHGSFANAVKSSTRLQHKFGKAVTDSLQKLASEADAVGEEAGTFLVKLKGGSVSMRSAPQRFASMLQVVVNLCHWSEAVVWLLCAEVAIGENWALEVLQLLSEPREHQGVSNWLLLSLLAEFISAVRSTVKRLDHNKAAGINDISLVASKIEDMKKELSHLFDVEDAAGASRVPFCVDPNFTTGYCNVTLKALRLSESQCIVAPSAGKLLFFRPRAESQTVAEWLARELGSILNVRKVFEASIRPDFDSSLPMAFRPLNLELWANHRDCEIQGAFEPLAAALGLDLLQLEREYLSVRPTAQRIRDSGDVPDSEIWKAALRRLHESRRPANELASLGQVIHLTNCLSESTGRLEQDIQHLQAITEGRKASMDPMMAKALFKIKVDGPAADKFVVVDKDTIPGRHLYRPSELCMRAQNVYAAKFGSKNFKLKKRHCRIDKGSKKGHQHNIPHAAGGAILHIPSRKAAEVTHAQQVRQSLAGEHTATDPKATLALSVQAQGDRWTSEQPAAIAKSQDVCDKKRRKLEDPAEAQADVQASHDKQKALKAKNEGLLHSLSQRNLSRQILDHRLFEPRHVALWLPKARWSDFKLIKESSAIQLHTTLSGMDGSANMQKFWYDCSANVSRAAAFA